MTTLKLRQIGNSVGVILPKETLSRLKVDAGDTLYMTDGPGGVHLTPYDPGFEKQMALSRRIMKEDRDVLRELAK
jgi:putative addiction module antidote